MATTNTAARTAYRSVQTAIDALLVLEVQLESDLENLTGPAVEDQLELLYDLRTDRTVMERAVARAAKVARNTNPKEN